MSSFNGSYGDNADLNPFADPKSSDINSKSQPSDFDAFINPFDAKPQVSSTGGTILQPNISTSANMATTLPQTSNFNTNQPSTFNKNYSTYPNPQQNLNPTINSQSHPASTSYPSATNSSIVSGDIVPTDQLIAQQKMAQTQKELQKRQEELEKKAADLERKENELRRQQGFSNRQNNWPPLPKFIPIQPCFYQDIEVEIPLEFQKIVKTLYYLWLGYILVIMLNMLASLAYFVTEGTGTTFGLSILWLMMFTPCSFLCWYRPAYKAFRSDSSFNFFLFFFVFFFQFCINIIQAIGIDNFGTCGWVNALGHLRKSGPASTFMFLVAAGFTALAVVGFFMLIKVHRVYRSTGASFAKAQQEFTTGFMSNPTVRQAGWNVATNMATGGLGASVPPSGDSAYSSSYGTAARY